MTAQLIGLCSEGGGLTPADATPIIRSWPGAVRLTVTPLGHCLLGATAATRGDAVSVALNGGLRALVLGELSPASDHPIAGTGLRGAEAVLALYRRHGEKALANTNGLFCAFVWDESAQVLTVHSDRVGGFYPVYYTARAGSVAVATRMQLLLGLPWVRRTLRLESLYALFATGYILPPDTMLSGIHKLGPGEVLRIQRGRVSTCVVDRIPVDAEPLTDSKELVREFQDLLTKSVRAAASTSGKRAYLLSGGIDSSIIATLASAVDREGVAAYTAAFRDSELDESRYARMVADSLGCQHTIVDLSGPELLDVLPQIVWDLGEPTYDFSVIPTYHLLRHASQQAEVVVSGDGPDHLFCRYNPLAAKRAIAHFIRWIPAGISLPASWSPTAFVEKIRRAGRGDLLLAYQDLFALPTWGLPPDRSLRALFGDVKQGGSTYLNERSKSRRRALAGLLRELTYVDFYIDGSFGVFNKVGAMARANGLVAREPYLDRDVVDFILRLPQRERVRGRLWRMLISRAQNKYLLKYELGGHLLPRELIYKPKAGFTPPMGRWLKTRLGRVPVERWLCRGLQEENVFELSAIQRMVYEHCNGVRNWAVALFLVLSTDLWYRMNVLHPHPTAPRWTLNDVIADGERRG